MAIFGFLGIKICTASKGYKKGGSYMQKFVMGASDEYNRRPLIAYSVTECVQTKKEKKKVGLQNF